MKSMTYIVLESYAYVNALVTKYLCTTTNFSLTYLRTHSDLLKPGWYLMVITFFRNLAKNWRKEFLYNSLFPFSGNAVACNLNRYLMTDIVFLAKDN